MDGDAPLVKFAVNAVRLQQAVLCPNCEVVSDSPHDACMVCGSRSLLPLGRVLGRTNAECLPASRENTAQRPDTALGTVFVLTSPMPHKPRHRRRASQR